MATMTPSPTTTVLLVTGVALVAWATARLRQAPRPQRFGSRALLTPRPQGPAARSAASSAARPAAARAT